MNRAKLPIDVVLGDLLRAVDRGRSVVLKAPPGAGKSTGVPAALLDVKPEFEMILVQPRRLAARSVAQRIAHLRGTRLGAEVGYQVRFDRKVSAATRLTVMTTGILLRRLQSDPLLPGVTCVLLDEFHERSLEMDVAFGMLHRVRETFRDDLRLVVMSATMDPNPVVDFLGDADALVSQGRSYPVETRHVRAASAGAGSRGESIEQQVARTLPSAIAETPGHVLVFLPGIGEIKRTESVLSSAALGPEIRIESLYGDLSATAQSRVIAESECRKIILSTNIAETSVTIPGVTAVIDSGLARVMTFDDRVGLSRLEVERISQASADQRAGRAGRTMPGVCWRLWSKQMHRSLASAAAPEILRSDFASAALMLAAWGERDPFDFPWLTPPRPEAVERSGELLRTLGAMDHDGTLTSIGRTMAELPLHPRISRFMLRAADLGAIEQGAYAAALLTERDPFAKQGVPDGDGTCDLASRVGLLERAPARRGESHVSVAALKNIRRVAEQLRRRVEAVTAASGVGEGRRGASDHGVITRCLLAAFPDRIVRRREEDPHRGRMIGGRGVRIDLRSRAYHRPHPDSRLDELLLAIDVDSKDAEAIVRRASCLNVDWIPATQVQTTEHAFFNTETGSVAVRQQTHVGDLILRETPLRCRPDARAASILFRHAREALTDLSVLQGHRFQRFVARVELLGRHVPEEGLRPIDDDHLRDLLESLCVGRISIAELKAAPWLHTLVAEYDYQQLQWIEREAPERLIVPSGNAHAIDYESGKPPILRVKIQELFGLAETPRIAGGRVPIQLHLQGPNRRTEQITEDLKNFWHTTYVLVRKQLRGRYPKHHWPVDPCTATATRNGLKPK